MLAVVQTLDLVLGSESTATADTDDSLSVS